MHQALYRSFRPETFSGLLGQEHIIKILKNQISENTISHAYLFCGTRGTGKTSTARILAKGVNCTADECNRPCGECNNCREIRDGVFLDVIEIDAASNNGVENIRELRESVKYPPVSGRKKVYIIDEVHMLSAGAFNALLKTLEEPPEHVMFILATTEPQKLPATIMSRCLRLDFRRISEKQMKEGLRLICGKINVRISDSALGLIVSNSDGSVRDALSLLDQCISSGGNEIVREDVLEVMGTSGEDVFLEMTDLIEDHKVADALLLLDRIIADGKDVRQLMKDWVSHYRSLLITKFIEEPEHILNASTEYVDKIREQSERIALESINRNILELSATLGEAKWSTQPRILLELCVVKMGKTQIMEVPLQKNTEYEPINKPVKKEKVKQEKSPEATGTDRKKQQGSPEQNLEKLWQKIIQECARDDNGCFNMLSKGTRLSSINESVFIVSARNDLSVRYAEDHRKQLEDLVEVHAGKRLRMECRLNSDLQETRDTTEEVAAKISSILETDIEII